MKQTENLKMNIIEGAKDIPNFAPFNENANKVEAFYTEQKSKNEHYENGVTQADIRLGIVDGYINELKAKDTAIEGELATVKNDTTELKDKVAILEEREVEVTHTTLGKVKAKEITMITNVNFTYSEGSDSYYGEIYFNANLEIDYSKIYFKSIASTVIGNTTATVLKNVSITKAYVSNIPSTSVPALLLNISANNGSYSGGQSGNVYITFTYLVLDTE